MVNSDWGVFCCVVVTRVSRLRVVGGVCSLCSSDSCIVVKSGWQGCVRCVVVTHVPRLTVTGGVYLLCSSDSCIEVKSGWRGVFVV